MASEPPTPPDGFIDLATAYTSANFSFVNIVGVVIDLMPPRMPQNGRDATLAFRLLDRKLFNWVSGSEGLLVRYFRADPTQLPRIQNIGDVVLIRQIKMNTWAGQRSALSNYATECTVFPSGSIPSPTFAIAYQGKDRIKALGIERDVAKLNMKEQSYVISLKKDMTDVVDTRSHKYDLQIRRREDRPDDEPPAKRQKSDGPFGAKFKLVKDLDPRVYADLCGEVVKSIPAGYGGCDLYITDYTSNNLLRQYDPPESDSSHDMDGDSFGYMGGSTSKKPWPGPYGTLTMKINVKHPHVRAANQFKGGDVVLLQNVKTRVTDAGPWLEGDMWPDDLSPEKVKARKLEHHEYPQVKALLGRKEQYWKTRETRLGQKQVEERQKEGKSSKKSGKKKNKHKKTKQEDDIMKDVEETSEPVEANPKLIANRHVRCSHGHVPLSSIKRILDPEESRHTISPADESPYTVPFVNARYRAKVRIVDFQPKTLEDFARQLGAEDYDSDDSMGWQYDAYSRHEWSFSLLLEDVTMMGATDSDEEDKRLWVQVHHEHAQFLFGNAMEDPQDLRSDSHLLAKLREQMFILWGNLEEHGGGPGLDNKPFECCIQEYGVEMDDGDPGGDVAGFGWQRMYSMFGVTIL